MHFLKSLIGYFIAGLLLFIVTLLVLIQSLLGNQMLFDPIIKFSSRVIPAAFGIKIQSIGRELIDSDKTYIFMANHVNIFDVFILYGYIPNFIRAVELEDHFQWPLWGLITRRMGNIPISHKNTAEALKSLETAKNVISHGTSIGILPEGHRTRDGKLQPFMRGPFRLAKNAEVDIVPIVMKGLWERKAVKSWIVHPGTVDLVFGEPIRSDVSKELTDRELMEKVRGIFLDMQN